MLALMEFHESSKCFIIPISFAHQMPQKTNAAFTAQTKICIGLDGLEAAIDFKICAKFYGLFTDMVPIGGIPQTKCRQYHWQSAGGNIVRVDGESMTNGSPEGKWAHRELAGKFGGKNLIEIIGWLLIWILNGKIINYSCATFWIVVGSVSDFFSIRKFNFSKINIRYKFIKLTISSWSFVNNWACKRLSR